MKKPKLDLRKEFIATINERIALSAYTLPYVLKTDFLEELIELADNAPDDYIVHVRPSFRYPEGMVIVLELLE